MHNEYEIYNNFIIILILVKNIFLHICNACTVYIYVMFAMLIIHPTHSKPYLI